MEIVVTKREDIAELKEKRKYVNSINKAFKKEIINEIKNWDITRDNFKFQFFFNLIVNSYYTKDLLDVINKDYPDNTDSGFKFHKENGLL